MSLRNNGTTSSKDSAEKSASDAIERVAIDQFKKSGEFDTIRKDTLRKWEASEDGIAFKSKLQAIVTAEVERDHSLLARDRGKAATLVGGAVERTQLYPEARLAAAKNIFQSEEFKNRIYESMKRHMDSTDQESKDTKQTTVVSAQDAASAFIKREQGS